MELDELERGIDALLPQTQCTRCGFADCRSYAVAIAGGSIGINRCPPGGVATIARLAALTGKPAEPLDPACGPPGPLEVAKIDEALCIGCTLCIAACPVDAIIGAPKRLHGVLAILCSGCGLCLPPCPVDCIEMVPGGRVWTQADADAARRRHDQKRARRDSHRPVVPAAGTAEADTATRTAATDAATQRTAAVAAAMARARGRRPANTGIRQR